MNFLSGYKTYLVAAATIAAALASYSQGQIDIFQLIQVCSPMLAAGTLRSAINGAVKTIKGK